MPHRSEVACVRDGGSVAHRGYTHFVAVSFRVRHHINLQINCRYVAHTLFRITSLFVVMQGDGPI